MTTSVVSGVAYPRDLEAHAAELESIGMEGFGRLAPQPQFSCSKKVIIRTGTDDYTILSKSSRKAESWVAIRVLKGNGEGGKSDVNLNRVQHVSGCVWAAVFKKLATASGVAASGVTFSSSATAWDPSVSSIGFSGAGTTFGGSVPAIYGWQIPAAVAMTVTGVMPNRDGYINIAFYPTGTSVPEGVKVEYSVNGGSTWVTLDAAYVFDGTYSLTANALPRFDIRKYQVGRNSVSVRVTNNAASGTDHCRVAAINMYDVDQAWERHSIDGYIHIMGARFTDNDNDGDEEITNGSYVDNGGASDYAIRYNGTQAVPANGTDRYVGSYHGEEVHATTPVWYVDGQEIYSFTTGLPIVGTQILLEQDTTLADGAISVKSVHDFSPDGGVIKHITVTPLTSPCVIENLMLGMGTAEPEYNLILHPIRQLYPDDDEYGLGNCNLVIQRDTNRRQSVETWSNTQYNYATTARGGTFLKQLAGQYSKIYFAPVGNVETELETTTAQVIQMFV